MAISLKAEVSPWQDMTLLAANSGLAINPPRAANSPTLARPVSSRSTAVPAPPDTAGRGTVLLVDDDADYREAAGSELDYLGFNVVPLDSAEALFAYFAKEETADVIVLDWKLPNGLGIELLPQLRQHGIAVPVVFLTGVPATAYESAALDLGALDFIDKARGLAILSKRIRLIIEAGKGVPMPTVEADASVTPEPAARGSLRCGRLLLRAEVSRAYWDEVDVGLTVTEFNILHMMVSHAGEYVTYRSIYDCVHHAGFVAGSGEEGFRTNVRSSIKRIRNKFRFCDDAFSEIENFPAFGYRWCSAPADPA